MLHQYLDLNNISSILSQVTNEERTDIKVGLTVLVGIALLLAGIGWAKGWNTSNHEEKHRAVFTDVGGLKLGDPVTINGVERGTVREIDARDSDVARHSGVLVTMVFPEHVDLRSDASASISMLELMSGKKIELKAGISPQPLDSNAIIPGKFAGDIGSMVAMITSLSGSIESITGKADTLFASLNNLMQGDSLKTKLDRTLDKASGALTHVDDAATRASALLAENGAAITRTINEADSALRTLSAIAGENRAGLRVLIDSGGRAIADARAAMARIDSLLASADRKNTLLYRLTKDEGFAMRLDSTVTSILKLSESLRLQGLDANIRFWSSSKRDTSKSVK
jgi:phospholipid/cholesterol/gamma-HCH transport system substrate-binding protein